MREREEPVEDIEADVHTSVANVAEIVSRDTAHVHPNLTGHFWPEKLLLFAHRVVQPQLRQTRFITIPIIILSSTAAFGDLAPFVVDRRLRLPD